MNSNDYQWNNRDENGREHVDGFGGETTQSIPEPIHYTESATYKKAKENDTNNHNQD